MRRSNEYAHQIQHFFCFEIKSHTEYFKLILFLMEFYTLNKKKNMKNNAKFCEMPTHCARCERGDCVKKKMLSNEFEIGFFREERKKNKHFLFTQNMSRFVQIITALYQFRGFFSSPANFYWCFLAHKMWSILGTVNIAYEMSK